MPESKQKSKSPGNVTRKSPGKARASPPSAILKALAEANKPIRRLPQVRQLSVATFNNDDIDSKSRKNAVETCMNIWGLTQPGDALKLSWIRNKGEDEPDIDSKLNTKVYMRYPNGQIAEAPCMSDEYGFIDDIALLTYSVYDKEEMQSQAETKAARRHEQWYKTDHEPIEDNADYDKYIVNRCGGSLIRKDYIVPGWAFDLYLEQGFELEHILKVYTRITNHHGSAFTYCVMPFAQQPYRKKPRADALGGLHGLEIYHIPTKKSKVLIPDNFNHKEFNEIMSKITNCDIANTSLYFRMTEAFAAHAGNVFYHQIMPDEVERKQLYQNRGGVQGMTSPELQAYL